MKTANNTANAGAAVDSSRHPLRPVRTLAVVAATMAAFALTACGSSSDKNYDISPIFPLSSNKCAKYNGDSKGEHGIGGCWVTQADCERAAADWRIAMKNVPDAIQFRC